MVRTLALVLAALIAAPAAPAQDAACPPPAETVQAVAAHADGAVVLADGRTLRLAGVELSDAGRAAFVRMAANRTLTVRPLGRTDRWGRQPAHVDEIEEALLTQGMGHAAAQTEGACLAPLLAAEIKARSARRGVWAVRDYVVDATDGAALTARLGDHILAEGKVISARTHRGRVYLNFARYWKSGLSLIIAEKDWPLFSGGAAAETFVGKRVRARGRLEYRSGPAIFVGAADRIEMAGR